MEIRRVSKHAARHPAPPHQKNQPIYCPILKPFSPKGQQATPRHSSLLLGVPDLHFGHCAKQLPQARRRRRVVKRHVQTGSPDPLAHGSRIFDSLGENSGFAGAPSSGGRDWVYLVWALLLGQQRASSGLGPRILSFRQCPNGGDALRRSRPVYPRACRFHADRSAPFTGQHPHHPRSHSGRSPWLRPGIQHRMAGPTSCLLRSPRPPRHAQSPCIAAKNQQSAIPITPSPPPPSPPRALPSFHTSSARSPAPAP